MNLLRLALATALFFWLPALASAQVAPPLPPGPYIGGCPSSSTCIFSFAGGYVRTLLTTSSPTSCTTIQSYPGYLRRLVYAGSSAETSTITIYDDATCTNGDQLFSIAPAVGYTQQLDEIFLTALSYSLSGALHANLYIGRD